MMDDRQNEARWVTRVVENQLRRAVKLGSFPERRSRVRVAIEPWKVAARHIEADSMPLEKQIAGRTEVDRDFCWRTGSEAASQHAVIDRAGRAVGMDVHQLRREVGLRRRRGDPQRDAERAGHLDVTFERSGGVDEDVLTRL